MNHIWDYKPLTHEQEGIGNELAKELQIHPTLGALLIKRGIQNAGEARSFFHPQLADLHDPFLMKDMALAVDRLNKAISQQERIMIYGDYDVDGTTAVALVYTFIEQFYSNIEYYIPDRDKEGYGISDQVIDDAKARGVKLIVILDCGIKAVSEVAYAKEQGIEFIICDHHTPDEELPQAVAILNAKRLDNTYPYEHLSGCGVGFKFMQAFAKVNGIRFQKLIPLLDYVAVSIASDIVPVVGENRILAYYGLRQLNKNPNIGLKAIVEVCGLAGKELSMSDVVFKIGPRINASGRIQTGDESVSLLIEKNPEAAKLKAEQINAYNETRKDIDKNMTEEAGHIVEQIEGLANRHSIVLYNEEWHRGVIGIVASRLTEVYYRPSVVLTLMNGCAAGSARSVMGFDVYKAIENCRDLLINFGGHTYAAGLSMKVENVEKFALRFEEYVSEHILPEQQTASVAIDAQLDFKEISMKFYRELSQFAPYGPENPKPIFASYKVFDYGTSKIVGRKQEHLKLELVDSKSGNVMNGIAFGRGQQWARLRTRGAFDVCYTIEENAYRSNELQLQIEDIRTNES